MTIMAVGGINWCWYADFNRNDDGTATLNRYWRQHRYNDPGHPYANCTGALVEDSDRNVVAIKITGGDTLEVSNPKNIFSYT